MGTAPLVSVVTPFYNTREFLDECINSVLRQTFEDWEYVLVDNCSTDGSSEIAACYASRFPGRIRLIRTESFLSQVENYNFALSCIAPTSKYCKVVQADDWLFPDCVRNMVEVADAHPTVGIVGAYELEGEDVRLDGLPYPSTKLRGHEVCRLYFFRDMYLFGTPTSILLRSDLVRSRRPFYDVRYAPFEDGHACFDLLKACDFGFVHQVLTYTRRDNESIMSKVRPFGQEFFLHYSMLVVHGRDYLSQDEYDRCLKRVQGQYFLYLAKGVLSLDRKSPEFWEFHRKGLASVNRSLDWRLLWKSLPSALVQKTLDRMWAIWSKAFA